MDQYISISVEAGAEKRDSVRNEEGQRELSNRCPRLVEERWEREKTVL
jgi:hypothetical protein